MIFDTWCSPLKQTYCCEISEFELMSFYYCRQAEITTVFWCCSYSEVNADCLILAMDFVCEVVEEPHNGGFLQRHGRAEARAYYSRPCQSDALPVMQVGQAHSAVIPKKTVQGTLETYKECFSENRKLEFLESVKKEKLSL